MVRRKQSQLSDDPLWYKDAVIYQLHVKSFFDSNDDGIGDFPGLISKLDHIVELGVNAIWLLPFYPSPRRDDGYDISEYADVHPDYGSLADFRHLIAAAHERGIRVITELVINHTSDQHPWFQRARRAKPGSAARNFYVWSNDDHKYAGTRVIFCDTEKSNWTWDEVAGAFYWHRFYAHQPDLNFDHPRVLKTIIAVMRFWLDLGVDGLRLDAVPYLVEREGTSNENLPETHAILKHIRAELDASYSNRMLIAEANQWPEDAQEYFGDGDECHVAFNFPLMPRMYMAIAKEDRFPVTDIMRQIPLIPVNCQWALFLRNHDELTLEMVTDSERDYLWQVYAGDRRARLNLGIRRRLAPLLDRDRRRVELMTGLLLSLPGTPVIYYGDEIGMGDNIHLGDRDGVRTPMQWSFDRNGGFSRADPEQLVLPPIMDAVSGYGAVNVESQRRNPHSLLNWTRRMLAVRQRSHVFGRGSMRFLHPGNRKILAYIRELDEQTVLCVANLSHASQAVELDLAEFDGRILVEMIDATPFPPIGRLSYLLTLPPYGFFWFELRAEATLPSWRENPPEMMPEYTTLVLRSGFQDLTMAGHRSVLENEVLPAYLPKRRWFASKNRTITKVRILAMLPWPAEETLITEVAVESGETTDRYVLPLGIAWDDQNPNALVQQLALARVRRGARVGFLTDAFALETFSRGLLAACGTRITKDDAELAFSCAELPQCTEDATPVRWLAAEHSNSSLILDESVFIKLYRRIEDGVRPEEEIARYLAAAGYGNTPAYLGSVVRTRNRTSATLAMLQQFLPNQGDGWNWAQDYLGRAIYNAAGTDTNAAEALEGYAAFAGTIGRRLGELHAVLSAPTDSATFAPELASAADVEQWVDQVREGIESAFSMIEATQQWPDTELGAQATALLTRRKTLLARLPALGAAGIGTLRTVIHGDFHLAQVLVSSGDVFIVDLEGEPAIGSQQRRAKASPLKDLAGILRSFDYASTCAHMAHHDAPAEGEAVRQEWLERFRARAFEAVVASYAAASGRSADAFGPAAAVGSLLRLFLLEKAAYEIRYEIANRPTWMGVPIRGMTRLTAELLESGA
ncbi:MAG TPA: maltose alpha-D-glucosyltransferase [Gammaproteobacteria bacterium]|nr:maltose alpha-D-glucosyltransferase [Gammaproteobacteria bacterium]